MTTGVIIKNNWHVYGSLCIGVNKLAVGYKRAMQRKYIDVEKLACRNQKFRIAPKTFRNQFCGWNLHLGGWVCVLLSLVVC